MKISVILAALLSAASPAYAELIDQADRTEGRQNIEERRNDGARDEEGVPVGWETVRDAHRSGLMSAVVTRETQAFDRHNRVWIMIPQGAELTSIGERCTGWMNVFLTAGYAAHDGLYFREWDISFRDKASGNNLSDLLEVCHRPRLTREHIVSAQQEGLVQAFTNKSIALMGENGALIYVGPRFRNHHQFEVEWQSRSTSGILRIAANRHVTLENEPCRPFSQVKVHYAGGTFLIRAVDLDIRMADQNLSKTPLGPAFSLFCDER